MLIALCEAMPNNLWKWNGQKLNGLRGFEVEAFGYLCGVFGGGKCDDEIVRRVKAVPNWPLPQEMNIVYQVRGQT